MSLIRLGRGQPLIALVAVLGGWIGGRAATWAPPALVTEAEAVPTPAPPAYLSDPRGGSPSRLAEADTVAQDPAGQSSAGYTAAGYGPSAYSPIGYAPVAYGPIGYGPPG